jgi:APA family basic amino acid/polyamine antiporter
MLGTGVFAVWTPAWALAGPWLMLALAIAAGVAALNATSSARLAMVHPESGGSYAYGRRRLSRTAGNIAGVSFVIGKSASSAAAALTIGAYLWPGQERAVAWLAIVIALAIDLRGIVASTRVAAVLVSFLLVVIGVVVTVGLANVPPHVPGDAVVPASPLAVVASAGLLFVAFAGYARITVLGEEVRDPRHTIPRAITWSFGVVLIVYVVVAATVVLLAGRGVVLGQAPLASIGEQAHSPAVDAVVTVGAIVGAGAVLVSLIAGMGRTLFAMASNGDAPPALARLSGRRVPFLAAISAAGLAAVVAALGELAWALAISGVSILAYYSVAHLVALTLPRGQRPPRAVPILGLVACIVVLGSLAWAAVAGLLDA